MAYIFGDGFDPYTATTDLIAGYWDGGTPALINLVSGRFAGGRAIEWAATTSTLTKASGQNDQLHHLTFAIRQTAAVSGTTLGHYFTLYETSAPQCSVVFRQDGAILLTGGSPGGAAIATYTGAVTAANTWFAFEIEVFVSNTAGYMNVRKNGSATNDFASATNLDTRGGSASLWANKLTIGLQGVVSNHQIDDLLWRSGAAGSVPWVGDLKCITRAPASDASVAFARSSGATNASCVDEAQQDALTTYVSDATPGNADFYNIGAAASVPATTVAVTTRAYMAKSDAGARTAAVQLKSGGTTVASPTLSLTTGFLWTWRTDTTNPATGTAWTAGGVDAVTVGPKTVA
jgi:hypothetical protein